MIRTGAAVLAAFLGAPAPGTPNTTGEPIPATTAGDPAPATETPDPAPSDEPDLVDEVLPCGLRVMVARDRSLPVAAVVLALETGSEDDPADQPGLLHALTYQVLQGNRELKPHAAAALAHDAGGFATLAFGPAQIRFESLIPQPLLNDALWLESRRLRAITVTERTWGNALATARRDPARRWSVAPEARAAAHGVDGLAHEGRAVTGSLDAMVPGAVASQLADRLTYRRATLAVVSPGDPTEVLARVATLMADLPAADRDVDARRITPGRTEVEVGRERGNRLVMAIPGEPGGLELARVLCKGFNRQRPTRDDPRRAVVRCHLAEDPRRPVLVLRVGLASQARALVATRMERLLAGRDRGLLDRQRRAVLALLDAELSQPLSLARRLTWVGPDPVTHVATAAGRTVLESTESTVDGIQQRFSADRAVLLIPGRADPRSPSRDPGVPTGTGKAPPEGPAPHPKPAGSGPEPKEAAP